MACEAFGEKNGASSYEEMCRRIERYRRAPLDPRGQYTVTPDHRVRVSRRLKANFDNGEPYYSLSGNRIWLPGQAAAQPGREFLEWHADTVYRG